MAKYNSTEIQRNKFGINLQMHQGQQIFCFQSLLVHMVGVFQQH